MAHEWKHDASSSQWLVIPAVGAVLKHLKACRARGNFYPLKHTIWSPICPLRGM